ncbi:uncharacterized protein IL334_000571 [Kwoniella shivajii]|uniref:Rab-GAP TBC domain-containing protein n=1 Tax=Kwoniella shivajii TaxID=564305 RepID=A0ABZ1CPP7_9TREE|nr:hypothetical protein IL334_000571 [Kwoniella shivajii]
MTSSIREEAVFPRPSSHEIQSTWKSLFSDPLISPSRLKATALTKGGLGESAADGGVILRSVYWRFYHNLLPPPTSPSLFPASLQSSREAYNSLRRRYLIAPDGRWASDCTGSGDQPSPGPSAGSSSSQPSSSKREGWDPLSLDSSSPWKTWFAHVDLRSTISQDVERTFPDIPYFQSPKVRRCLTTSLFLFSVLNPDVGYRQGMHELLACCFLAIDRDSLDHKERTKNGEDGKDEAMWCTLDNNYVEHDAFQLFQAIMKGAKEFYEWRAEEGPIRNKSATAPQAPIITRCNYIHTSLIRRIDPQLWERLETEGVEAQIWAIRWIRLIFTRELPFSLAMRIWDGVFAEDPGLGLLDFICVAMLLLIRNELIEADYPTLLTQLLHYPSPSTSYPFEPFLVLSQALFLRNNISPAAGVEIVIQNQDILGVKASPPERSEEERVILNSRNRGGMISRGSGRGSRGRAGMGGLAQGIFERAQAAGLDKAFLATVSDLRKNLPDSATAYSYLPNLPFSPSGTPSREIGSFSTIPSTASALPRSFTPSPTSIPNQQVIPRPAIPAQSSVESVATEQSSKDAELEMAELRLAMVGMGKAMSEWLSLLRPSSTELDGSDRKGEEETAEDENAWRGLEKIKNSLLDAAGKETEQIVREWAWHEGLETPQSRSTTPAPLDISDQSPHTENVPLAMSDNIQCLAPQKEVQVGEGTLEIEDTTPTLPNFSTMPLPASFPSPSISAPFPSNPRRNDVSQTIKPTLNLSSRSNTPSTGLPRVPMTAPLPATSSRLESTTSQSRRQEREEMPAEIKEGVDGDPLAGLGVTQRGNNEGWKKDKRSSVASATVDPLLGVGVR